MSEVLLRNFWGALTIEKLSGISVLNNKDAIFNKILFIIFYLGKSSFNLDTFYTHIYEGRLKISLVDQDIFMECD